MNELKIVYLDPQELTPYENNTRKHTPDDVEGIKRSILADGFNDPIGVWGPNNLIVEGHGRQIAALELGLEKVPCIRLDYLTENQRKEYAIRHNRTAEFSEWDFTALEEEIAALEIEGLDLSDLNFTFEDQKYEIKTGDAEHAGNLLLRFTVPPFSVLDARQGYWQDRKKAWLEKTGNLSETRDGEFGKFSGGGSNLTDTINGGTSNFDPVLAEVMYKWFCPPAGHILDPFGGEQTKGVVAGELGYKYTACEIREEQCALNRKKTSMYNNVRYICGDSNQIGQHIKERGFDMLLTSPPYYDLEVYSKEDMSALGTYEEFMAQYKNIFRQCYEMLADDTFAVVKVGEIRDKATGVYRSFVPGTIEALTDIGFNYYNELVLVTAVGTAPIRANRSMNNRKVVKLHQNVLVFYKGDPKNISMKFPQLEFDEVMQDGSTEAEYVF